MKKVSFILILFSIFTTGFSQKIKTNFEILKIMTDSKLSYEIKSIEKPIECQDYSNNLNYNNVYRVTTDSVLSTYKYEINEKVKPFLEKAEFYFEIDYIDSALYYYKLAVNEDSTLYYVMTYIGQMYGIKRDYDNSIKWYKRVIEKNYIDYMAHWFLADIYISTNQINDAVDEITVAMILNRNNKRIKNSMVNIYKMANRDTSDWYFNPQVELIKISEDKINVGISEKWTGYAMAKAIWTFEPGYRESMGVSKEAYSIIEDKECLIALIVAIENAEINISNDAQLRILKESIENKHFLEYIFYEILLPQNPFVAYQLSEKSILDIKDYILNIRNPKY